MYRPSRYERGGVSMPQSLAQGEFKEAIAAAEKEDKNSGSDLRSKAQHFVKGNGNVELMLESLEKPAYKDHAEFLIGQICEMGRDVHDPEMKAFFTWMQENIKEPREKFLDTALDTYAKTTAKRSPSPRR